MRGSLEWSLSVTFGCLQLSDREREPTVQSRKIRSVTIFANPLFPSCIFLSPSKGESLSHEVTVLTVAFGEEDQLVEWHKAWTDIGFRCLVCDNGGSLSSDLPKDIRILSYNGNTGFGTGINRAVEAAESDLVLVTNPDTLPYGRNDAYKLIRNHSRGMISSGVTVDRHGRQVSSTGIWPSLPWIRKQLLRKAESLWRQDRFDWIQGSLMLFNREDFLNIGGFSPSFPLYFEDTDLCSRAKEQGFRINQDPDAVFFHYSGLGSSGSSSLRLACFHWGMVEFFKRNRRMDWARARRLVILKCLLRAASYNAVIPRHSAGYLSGLFSLLRDVPPPLPERSHG